MEDSKALGGSLKESSPAKRERIKSPYHHGRSQTMPDRRTIFQLGLDDDRANGLTRMLGNASLRGPDPRNDDHKRKSICVGTLTRLGREALQQGGHQNLGENGSKRNLLVDLDKIEKTAGKFKLRRRTSITLGELYEARKLRLETSRNGVINAELIHQEWRKKMFQRLYQAMKRRKMLMRLNRRSQIPDEVRRYREALGPKNGLECPTSTRTLSAPSDDVVKPFRSSQVITLDQQSKVDRKSSKIFVLYTEPEILLAPGMVKLARSSLKKPEGPYGANGFVFLSRHGEREDHVNPKWYLNAPNVFDPPLSQRGIRQASELGNRLKSERITHIFASPFTRTIETAIEVSKQIGVMIHIDYGLAEHMETKQFKHTCGRLQLDPSSFSVKVNSHEELLKRYPKYISPAKHLPDAKLNKWPASFPEEEEHLFERTNNTVKHLGMFAFEQKANVLLVSHQTPVEYMAFELCSEAEDKFVSVCCLTMAMPRKKDPKKNGWKLMFQHDDSFLSEPECSSHM